MFRTVPVSIIRFFPSLHTVYNEKKTLGDEQRNCPKHVEWQSKNELERLVHLVGFIVRILIRY